MCAKKNNISEDFISDQLLVRVPPHGWKRVSLLYTNYLHLSSTERSSMETENSSNSRSISTSVTMLDFFLAGVWRQSLRILHYEADRERST